MMRVYQPLCPDITFRLAADLSPDALEEDASSTTSASSSSSEEETKLKIFHDSNYSHHQSNHHHPTWYTQNASATAPATASPTASKTAKEIYNQGHSSHTTAATTSTTTTTTTTPLPSCSSTSSPISASATASGGHMSTSSQSEGDGLEKCHEELEPSGGRESAIGDCTSGSSLSPADDVNKECALQKMPSYHNHKAEDDHDDASSIEDVSLSQNVPNVTPISTPIPPSPSGVSSSTSVVGRRLMGGAEEGGGASGSSSDSEASARSKSSSLHLNIPRPLTKYHGPYTLACDVTPSPMEGVEVASTFPSVSTSGNGDASAATTSATPTGTAATTTPTPTSASTTTNTFKVPRRPRKLPEIPRKHQGLATASSTMERSIFDEIQEALIKEVSDDPFDASSTAQETEPSAQYPFILKHAGYLFDKKRLLIGYATSPSRSRTVSTSSVASEAGAAASIEEEISAAHAQRTSTVVSSAAMCSQRRRKNSDGDGPRRYSSTISTPYQDLEVTHRGMHRFIPRHADEIQIGIGDPIHVIKEYDDLWCEGVNLRTGERGIFPAMYANDLRFLEDSDGDEEEHWKFIMRYLGSVEVTTPSGDFALCQAINKVAQQGRIKTASLCILEINQYGIRMIDKSKEGHESQKFSNFFALKNISFCGTHPNNKRYFAFITKHPRENRFACHVFYSDRSTHRARDALGNAFKRFYQEYMAFTHPTEDIWME